MTFARFNPYTGSHFFIICYSARFNQCGVPRLGKEHPVQAQLTEQRRFCAL